MGGYQSRVTAPPQQQNFSNSEHVPARVHFSPELLKQIQREQETKVQQRPVPQHTVIPEEPESVQHERQQRIERERQIIAAKAQERVALKQAEEEAIRKASEAMDRVERKAALPSKETAETAKVVHELCMVEARRLTGMLEDASKLDDLFSKLKVYEDCVKREAQVRNKSGIIAF